VRCFNLPRHAGIPLLGGLLNVLSIENEVIPVNAASFENRHFLPPLSASPVSSKRNASPIWQT
jgi:hypothetical protein